MSIDPLGPGALDYLPCRYGASKLLFRGPKRSLRDPYIAFIGGTEVYGKFIADPLPALTERALDQPCVNLGFPNAGIDAFVHDPFVLEAAKNADVTVVQVMGAHNMTNRFYSVHPRRNDRFTAASQLLSVVYGEVDFSEYHFTRHMLGDLKKLSTDRFDTVRAELQQAWLARMRLLLGQISGRILLLWFAPSAPPKKGGVINDELDRDPLFITSEMIDQLKPLVTGVVIAQPSAEAVNAGTQGMVFSDMESPAAGQMLGPRAHEEAATLVVQALKDMRSVQKARQ